MSVRGQRGAGVAELGVWVKTPVSFFIHNGFWDVTGGVSRPGETANVDGDLELQHQQSAELPKVPPWPTGVRSGSASCQGTCTPLTELGTFPVRVP